MLTESNAASRAHATGSIAGTLKVIDPSMPDAPSTRAYVMNWSDSEVCVWAPDGVPVGATVHLRMADKILVGEVRQCEPMNDENEIRIQVREIL